ncbi:MAG: hypothetical protein MUC51_19355 [Anaerolineae bacterium]|jgi:hypothetical protein|nr:hypothetical protein [Anaerolineae bacterium]
MPDNQPIGGTPVTPPAGETPPAGTLIAFEEWLKGQDESIRTAYESHTRGLKSALDSERTQRNDLARQLKEASKGIEKGSDLERSLADLSGKLELAERRATFAEQATRPEIGCVNVKAAWALASTDGLFDSRGNPNWDAIKSAAPELFGAPPVRGNAGVGTGVKPPPAQGMNQFIRQAAGR